MSRIVLLNGVGSVGKSSLARAVQAQARGVLLHVQMDAFLDMLPQAYADHPESFAYRPQPGGAIDVSAGPTGIRLLRGMRRAVAALAACGNDIIVDDVCTAGDIADYLEVLSPFDLKLVAVRAPLAIIEQRERVRGDRLPGLAAGQFETLHRGIAYDLVLDSANSLPQELARQLCRTFHL